MGWDGLVFFFNPPWWIGLKNLLNLTQSDPWTPLTISNVKMFYFIYFINFKFIHGLLILPCYGEHCGLRWGIWLFGFRIPKTFSFVYFSKKKKKISRWRINERHNNLDYTWKSRWTVVWFKYLIVISKDKK